MIETVVIYVAFAIALGVIGYLLGWHRGMAGLPIGPVRRRKRQTPAQMEETAAATERQIVEKQRNQVRDDVEKKYPHLTQLQLDAATEEILAKGLDLRARIPRS